MARRLLVALLALWAMLTAGSALAQSVSITGPNVAVLQEGKSYSIEWKSEGLGRVNLIAYGTRTPMGTTPRGDFVISIAAGIPAESGKADWTVPWIDARTLSIKVKGYNPKGYLVASAERSYEFRPVVLANRTKDGIYLDLHKRTDQRLYVQKDGRITRVYLSSSSENYLWVPPNRHPSIPHDHAGVFRVLSKEPDHYSKLFHVHMRWALNYHGGHFIHATSSNLYRLLGRTASHGCNRLTLYDARQLYGMTPVGTRVEVIGPAG